MGAYACPQCVINYPVAAEFQFCPICQVSTNHDPMSSPDDDFAMRVDLALQPPDKVDWWRVEQLQAVGVPTEVALDWARQATVDLHETVDEFKALLDKGCPTELAVQILTPIW